MNIDWSAQDYSNAFGFVPAYGHGVAEWLTVKPGSSLIDLGCGNGTLTAKLAEKYQVTGVDASGPMLSLARHAYPEITFFQADIREYAPAVKVDAVFSNAVLHWVDDRDHRAVLANIAAALKPGGEFVCEFGGKGNAETVHRALESAFTRHGDAYRRPFFHPTIGDYSPRMENAGLVPVQTAFFRRWTEVESLEGWIRMFVKIPFSGMPVDISDAIIAEAVETARPDLYRDGIWHVDYVRLRIRAVRSSVDSHEVPLLP